MARIPAALSGLWKRERPMIGPRLDELEYLVPAAQRAAPPQHEAKMSGRDVQWYRDLGNILGRGASNYRVGQYEWTQEQIRDLTLCDGFAERAVDSLVLGSFTARGSWWTSAATTSTACGRSGAGTPSTRRTTSSPCSG